MNIKLTSLLIIFWFLIYSQVQGQDNFRVGNFKFEIGMSKVQLLQINPQLNQMTENLEETEQLKERQWRESLYYEDYSEEVTFSFDFINNKLFSIMINDDMMSGIFKDFDPISLGFTKTGNEKIYFDEMYPNANVEVFAKGNIQLVFRHGRHGFLYIDAGVISEIDISEFQLSLINEEGLEVLRFEMPVLEVIQNFGEPDMKSNAVTFGVDGEYNQKWSYTKSGIALDMLRESESRKVVNSITISDPCKLKTPKLIGIGSSKDDVVNAYKEHIEKEFSISGSIIVGSIYGGIIFEIQNEKVKSFFIGAGAE